MYQNLDCKICVFVLLFLLYPFVIESSFNLRLLIVLSSCFGLTGLALDRISSYPNNRWQSVKIGDACSVLLSDITSFAFAIFGQFSAKALPISSPALISLPGWIMLTPVCSASQARIYLAYRESKTHLLVLTHVPNLGPAQPPFWNTSTGFQSQLAFTSKLPSWLLSHSTP